MLLSGCRLARDSSTSLSQSRAARHDGHDAFVLGAPVSLAGFAVLVAAFAAEVVFGHFGCDSNHLERHFACALITHVGHFSSVRPRGGAALGAALWGSPGGAREGMRLQGQRGN